MITVVKPLTLVHESVDNLHNVPCNKLNWFLPLSYTTTEQFEGKILDQGAVVYYSPHKLKCHKIFFHMPCKLPSTSMFLLEMMMHAKNLFCMRFGNTHEMNKILICTMVLMSQNFLYIIWKKAWSFFRYTVLWISETNINYYTALKKPGSIKNPKTSVASELKACHLKLEDILNHLQSFIKPILWT